VLVWPGRARAAILLDFDGTLSPIVARPEDARPVDGAVPVLQRLVGRSASVTIVTGRPEAFIREHLPVDGLDIAGLYGFEGSAPELPEEVIEQVHAAAEGEAGATVERKGASVAVHVRNVAFPDAVEMRLAGRLGKIADGHGLEIRRGKRVLELIAAGSPGKGDVVRARVEGLDAALYAGDDEADLEAFDALDEAERSGVVVCRVAVAGPEVPADLVGRADEVVGGPAALVHLLETL
jgi:trehalose 6-phosphate phosphatase